MPASQLWAMFFASVVGMAQHPGNLARFTVADAARLADEMVFHYYERFGGAQCQPGQSAPQQ